MHSSYNPHKTKQVFVSDGASSNNAPWKVKNVHGCAQLFVWPLQTVTALLPCCLHLNMQMEVRCVGGNVASQTEMGFFHLTGAWRTIADAPLLTHPVMEAL